MSYGRVYVDLGGIDKAIGRAVRAGADLRPVWREFRKPMRKIQGEHITAQKGPDGVAWPGLAASTIKARLYRGGKAKKFTKKGRLRKGASRRLGKILSKRLPSRSRMKITRRSISLHARGRVRNIHQSGGLAGRRGRARIPARPYMYVDDKLAKAAFQRVSEHVASAFENKRRR